jgi:hypothetical protein
MKEIKVMYAKIVDELGYEREDIAFEKNGRIWIGRRFREPGTSRSVKAEIKEVIDARTTEDPVRAIAMGHGMLKKYSVVYPDTLGLMVDSAWTSGFSKE